MKARHEDISVSMRHSGGQIGGVTDPSGAGRSADNRLWRPAGLGWGAVSLAGLAVGLFPQIVSARATDAATLPALQAVATVQVGFLLLIYPLIVARRRRGGLTWPAVFLEALVWMVTALPVLGAGAYLADATVVDTIRTCMLISAAAVTGWGLAAMAGRRAARASLAVLIGVLVVLGGPAANYLALEFAPAPWRLGWLWHVSPVTFAWSVAASRQGDLVPTPVWAWLVWPVAGAALVFLDVFRPASRAARHRPGSPRD